jgi:hypothetical protein
MDQAVLALLLLGMLPVLLLLHRNFVLCPFCGVPNKMQLMRPVSWVGGSRAGSWALDWLQCV